MIEPLYLVVLSKGGVKRAHSIDEALNIASGDMCINRAEMRAKLELGEIARSGYGFNSIEIYHF